MKRTSQTKRERNVDLLILAPQNYGPKTGDWKDPPIPAASFLLEASFEPASGLDRTCREDGAEGWKMLSCEYVRIGWREND